MKLSVTLALLICAHILPADTLRISRVMAEAGPETDRMVQSREVDGETREEELFIAQAIVVGDEDVESAVRVGKVINVKLNDVGASKLAAVTKKMTLGRERLAIIVDGKVVSAPRVMAVLGANFQIEGGLNGDERSLENLARKMSGRPLLKKGEDTPPLESPLTPAKSAASD